MVMLGAETMLLEVKRRVWVLDISLKEQLSGLDMGCDEKRGKGGWS